MEHKLSALIVDDEENARKLLRKLLEETLFFDEIRTASSANTANRELSNYEPDIVFLDIKMPGKDGFEFLRSFPSLKNKPEFIFVTAYDQFALKAIKSHAFDYLLKPVDRKELTECIKKYIEIKNCNPVPVDNLKIVNTVRVITRLRINTRTGTVFINPENILYCKAEGNYTLISTIEKQHLCSINLGKVSEMLPENGFVRVGRSFIINFEHVTALDRKESQVTLAKNGLSLSLKLPRKHLKDIDNY